MNHKWENPHEWLNERLGKCEDVHQFKMYAKELLTKINADDIQDLFQDEMDKDGYFDRQKTYKEKAHMEFN